VGVGCRGGSGGGGGGVLGGGLLGGGGGVGWVFWGGVVGASLDFLD